MLYVSLRPDLDNTQLFIFRVDLKKKKNSFLMFCIPHIYFSDSSKKQPQPSTRFYCVLSVHRHGPSWSQADQRTPKRSPLQQDCVGQPHEWCLLETGPSLSTIVLNILYQYPRWVHLLNISMYKLCFDPDCLGRNLTYELKLWHIYR